MYEYRASAVRVIDADTIDIDIDLGFRLTSRQRVRLAGINAPEVNTPAGMVAKAYLTTYLEVGALLTVQSEKPGGGDKYGRYLATLWRGPVNVNNLLVTAGHAVAWDGTGVKP